MKTTIEEELKNRGLEKDVYHNLHVISRGSLIPRVDQDMVLTEAIFCESMSGGARQRDEMPLDLSLTKIGHNNHTKETEVYYQNYTQDYNPKDFGDISNSEHGKLLAAALAVLSTTTEFRETEMSKVFDKIKEAAKEIEEHTNGED